MRNRQFILLSGVALAAFLSWPVLQVHDTVGANADWQITSSAFAEDGGGSHGGGGKGKQGAGGHAGGSDSGHAGGSHGSSSGHGSSGDEGQGEPDEDSDAKGAHFKGGDNEHKPSEADRGGKPVWAQEGIPEIELGRLNVARSPEHVLNQAGDEAVSNFDTDLSGTLYSMTAEDFATFVEENYDDATRIDSPLENLSLFKDVMVDGTTQLPGVTPASTLDLAAIFLGSASDKTIPVSEDTVSAIVSILGLPSLTPEQTSTLAEKAEDVRAAILAGHGE